MPAALSAALLPFERDAAVYGLYFALPALLAWAVLRLRPRMPSWLPSVLGVLMIPWAIVMTTVALTAGYLIAACAVSIGVVLVVAWRLLTGRGGRRPAAGSR